MKLTKQAIKNKIKKLKIEILNQECYDTFTEEDREWNDKYLQSLDSFLVLLKTENVNSTHSIMQMMFDLSKDFQNYTVD